MGRWRRSGATALVLAIAASHAGGAQSPSYSSGQNVTPAFEGWEANPDGSFSLHFGYLNRNWDEEIDVPVGVDNSVSPGPADQGQPTHFLPRRNGFVFSVRVPDDFGTQELVWTLTTKGETASAYGTLTPDYFLDDLTIMSERGAIAGGFTDPVIRANRAPVLTVEGGTSRTVRMGLPLTLIAEASDDGVPERGRPFGSTDSQSTSSATYAPPRRITPEAGVGLRVGWSVFRGAGRVVFDPPQFKAWEDTRDGANSPWAPGWITPPMPPDGRIMVRATFDEPGVYVLRCRADDGGLWADEEVTVIVTP